jgi:hypothetical protein
MRNEVLRIQLSTRGGGVEIALKGKYKGHKMTAYQNYLGGGMLGAIANDCTVDNWRDIPQLVKKADELAEYYYKQYTGGRIEGFDALQKRPVRGY